ncbi:MAG: hypothetical protein KBD01_19235 [Acidobacteria bacterium]|nr:hypothetical protein [Acidobacteriota bacterium]
MNEPPRDPQEIARELRELTLRERELVSAGRLLDLDDIARRRAALFEALNAVLPPGPLAPSPLRDQILAFEHEARESLVLLTAIRDEIARELQRNASTRRAAGTYGQSEAL